MAIIDRRDMFASHTLFRDLEPAAINKIADLGVVRRLDANQLLFSKGDEGDALYGVMQGRIRISAGAPSGKEVIINIMQPGELFGEIALLDGGPRTADATSMGKSELLQIRRPEFVSFIEREPKIANHFLKLLCDRLRTTTEMLEDSVFLSLPGRLAKRLLSMARAENEPTSPDQPLDLKISQADLGQYLGVSRESINKHLQLWQRQQWIALGRGKVTILDVEHLQELVDDDELI